MAIDELENSVHIFIGQRSSCTFFIAGGKDEIAEQDKIIIDVERRNRLISQQSLIIAPDVIVFAVNFNLSASNNLAVDDFLHILQCILHCFDVWKNEINLRIVFQSNNSDFSLRCR